MDEIAKSKICNDCKQEFTLQHFYADPTYSEGVKPNCKACYIKAQKLYAKAPDYATEPEKSLSNQDQRDHIIHLRDNLLRNLNLIDEAIAMDYHMLKWYFKRYGDLYYRPVVGKEKSGKPKHGEPTEVVIEPLAGKYRATIKSLMETIRGMNDDLKTLGEDNPEAQSAKKQAGEALEVNDANARRLALRENFTKDTKLDKTPIQPEEDTVVEKMESKPEITKAPTEAAKPWRTPRPQSVIIPKDPQEVVSEPKPEPPKGPQGLSPAMKNILNKYK